MNRGLTYVIISRVIASIRLKDDASIDMIMGGAHDGFNLVPISTGGRRDSGRLAR